MKDPRYISGRQAVADRYGKSKRLISEFMANGVIPYVRTGHRTVEFRVSTLDAIFDRLYDEADDNARRQA
jgi:hypothetical protein